ncbi:hypothetical protein BHE90_013887 [Fusarium euwallaceae]|uniref:Uncharacterized protein n=2 Tax=Fusarium solani species complex TaxID=232080 RepID=A0A3M2RWT9_9HYPO|nr:hypothetical protein CDV36_010598 [Fusarium kuroshium]RTE71711.1 hypothetical protein BHE90_013887 [Fusarium euwallaceae]
MGHGDSKLPSPQMSLESAQRGVPPVIRATYKKSWSKIIVRLGEPDQEPVYCLSLPQGFYGKMIMHDGPDPDSPALGGAKPDGWRVDFNIQLPGIPGTNIGESVEILRHKNRKPERYWFGMQVGEGANRHVERFEWRRSHGSEVKSVGESKWGWKLVRVGHNVDDPNDEAEASGEEPDRPDGFTSDGKEVVAVWADSSISWKSMSKIGTFELRGSGRTGELGTQWAVMALLSCMCQWQAMMMASSTTTAVAAT